VFSSRSSLPPQRRTVFACFFSATLDPFLWYRSVHVLGDFHRPGTNFFFFLLLNSPLLRPNEVCYPNTICMAIPPSEPPLPPLSWLLALKVHRRPQPPFYCRFPLLPRIRFSPPATALDLSPSPSSGVVFGFFPFRRNAVFLLFFSAFSPLPSSCRLVLQRLKFRASNSCMDSNRPPPSGCVRTFPFFRQRTSFMLVSRESPNSPPPLEPFVLEHEDFYHVPPFLPPP